MTLDALARSDVQKQLRPPIASIESCAFVGGDVEICSKTLKGGENRL